MGFMGYALCKDGVLDYRGCQITFIFGSSLPDSLANGNILAHVHAHFTKVLFLLSVFFQHKNERLDVLQYHYLVLQNVKLVLK